MNIFSTTSTITRLDYYGNEYQATVIGQPKRNLAQLWKAFTEQDRYSNARTGFDAERVQRHFETELQKRNENDGQY